VASETAEVPAPGVTQTPYLAPPGGLQQRAAPRNAGYHERTMKPRIGLFAGDPSGIGPEVTAKLLADPETRTAAEIVTIGDAVPICPRAQASRIAGEYTIRNLRVAIAALRSRSIDALVYAPLNKHAMKLAGLQHDDELHFFAELFENTGPVSEINVCCRLWTSRVTSHVPLREVAGLLTVEKICDVGRLLHRTVAKSGIAAPRIAVAGLNPHAGEGGLFGSEEIDTIAPAVEQLRAEGLDAVGPLPADTLFIAAGRGDFQGVVTMYHDQGQIAMKLMGFERGVTVAGGLPAIITTPAHGTAFDIAGKGIANPSAMREAFRIACEMVMSR
jgi:4-hydroxythreonine-4-phosphate dehydrogenase